jgi:hypothetical protein
MRRPQERRHLITPRRLLALALAPLRHQRHDRSRHEPLRHGAGRGRPAPQREGHRGWNTDAYGYGEDSPKACTQATPGCSRSAPTAPRSACSRTRPTAWRSTCARDHVFRADGPDHPVIVIDGPTPKDVMESLGDADGDDRDAAALGGGVSPVPVFVQPGQPRPRGRQRVPRAEDPRGCHLDGHRLHGRLPVLHLRCRAFPDPVGAQRRARRRSGSATSG